MPVGRATDLALWFNAADQPTNQPEHDRSLYRRADGDPDAGADVYLLTFAREKRKLAI